MLLTCTTVDPFVTTDLKAMSAKTQLSCAAAAGLLLLWLVVRRRLPSPTSRRVAAEIRVPADSDGWRLEQLLLTLLPRDFPSKSVVKVAASRSLLLVDGSFCGLETVVAAGQRVQYIFGEQRIHRAKLACKGPPPLTLDVVFEDDWLAVIVKPPGICVQERPCPIRSVASDGRGCAHGDVRGWWHRATAATTYGTRPRYSCLRRRGQTL